MKQVKKLLVILPLVALFVLGSLPVLAAVPDHGIDLTVNFMNADGSASDEPTRRYNLPAAQLGSVDWGKGTVAEQIPEINKLTTILKDFITGTLHNGFQVSDSDLQLIAAGIYRDMANANADVAAAVSLRLPQVVDDRVTVMAYNIHNGRPVFTQMHIVRMDPSFNSTQDIAFSYYNNSGLSERFIFAGYARLNPDGTLSSGVTLAAARGEKFSKADLAESMNGTAEYAALVVPNFVGVEVRHTFPEGTRAELSENVDVPYGTWVTLQNSEGNLMDLPSIFRTRIQKVNEQGYTYRTIKYFNGLRPVTGLLGSWNWAGNWLGGDHDDQWIARVYYDVAVAAAKEVPTEKKVDAATAPQAQIQAPAAQAQAKAPVVAANTTTTPVNTLPVTGASDSIFLFLSSAALMAVGILFFKKH